MWLMTLLVFAITAVAVPAPQGSILQDVEQQLGPFTVAGQTFAVVLHKKRIADSETLALLEIRDTADTVQYQKTFPYQLEGAGFQETVSASAKLISGQNLAGLVIRYRRDSVSSGAQEAWQIFRSRDGKLSLLDPLSSSAATGPFTGAILTGARATPLLGTPDALELRVWTGNFYVIVPVRVDWQQGKTMPGQQCFEMGANASLAEAGCEMRVEAQSKPSGPEFRFVRLFSDAYENTASARHVVLGKDSTVEYLSAKALVKWTARGDESAITLADLWLKVLIDNSEDKLGWIHTDADFAAVGLPAGGPTP